MPKSALSLRSMYSRTLTVLFAGGLLFTGCLDEPASPERSPSREASQSASADQHPQDTFYDVQVAGDTIYADDLEYRPTELVTLDIAGENVSKQLDMYAPMECEKCTCSGGTCLCEGCSVRDI